MCLHVFYDTDALHVSHVYQDRISNALMKKGVDILYHMLLEFIPGYYWGGHFAIYWDQVLIRYVTIQKKKEESIN